MNKMIKKLISLIPIEKKYALLRDLADNLLIHEVIANGKYGKIQGNIFDWTIFRRYVLGQAWESNMVDAIIEFFKTKGNGTYLDVGANIGLTFIPVLQETNCYGYAFEASPINFPPLQQNCHRQLNQSKYSLYKIAVGNSKKEVHFSVDGANFGNHRISDQGNEIVLMDRFDDIIDLKDLTKPILAKVDIQGSEALFFEGAQSSLKYIDIMIVEYTPTDFPDNDKNDYFLSFLVQSFQKFCILEDKIKKFPSVEYMDDLDFNKMREIRDKISNNKRKNHENLLFLS